MKSYPVPPDPAGLTAAEAQAALNALHAGGLTHPLYDRSHAQHRDFVNYSMRLHTIIATAEADRQEAAAAAALEAALAATAGMTPQQCLDRAAALMATPGYAEGRLPAEERAKLSKEITNLYLAADTKSSTPAEMEDDDDDADEL
jgi:hypothetical protein